MAAKVFYMNDSIREKYQEEIVGAGERIIGYGKYMANESFRHVAVSPDVRRLEHSAFRNCPNLETVTLPYHIEAIGGYCFAGCGKLGRISIPARVMKVDYSAFKQCGSLRELIVIDNTHGVPEADSRSVKFRIPRLSEYMRYLYIEAAMSYFERNIGMKAYDSLFPRLETVEDRTAVALFRLETGEELDIYKQAEYAATLAAAVEYIIEGDAPELLARVGAFGCIQRQNLDYYIQLAARRSSGCAAYLLEYKHSLQGEGEYNFDL